MTIQPGFIIMLGSGETAASIRKVYDWLFKQMEPSPQVSILETPAGFEPNSDRVAGRIAEFLGHRLQNYEPQIDVVPARKRNTQFSPDDPDIIAPLLEADVIFMGPGSPTYTVRQLQDTLAWHTMLARHCLGASIILASAATLAISVNTLPVYEIYKVGEDLHWHLGLDFLGIYGLSLVLVPHWNNAEGGADLDTSRCYMGKARFEQLQALLPPKQTVVGIDEHTALVLDPTGQKCRVMGKGSVTLLQGDKTQQFQAGQCFSMDALGGFHLPSPQTVVPVEVWKTVEQTHQAMAQAAAREPSTQVMALVEKREEARARKAWDTADELRDEIADMGWHIKDNPDGPELETIS